VTTTCEISRHEMARRWDLVIIHRQRLVRVARSGGCEPHEADDIVHDAFLRVVTLTTVLDQRLPGLLTTVVRRLAVDRVRERARSDRIEQRLAGYSPESAPVDEAACDRSEAHWLAAHLDSLTAHDREVLLFRAAGHTPTSVAETLGMTPKAANCALTRARRTMRALWAGTLAVAVLCPSTAGHAHTAVASPTAIRSGTTTPWSVT
jgi:RNA polymerase sigma factor (sigma-70 family)